MTCGRAGPEKPSVKPMRATQSGFAAPHVSLMRPGAIAWRVLSSGCSRSRAPASHPFSTLSRSILIPFLLIRSLHILVISHVSIVPALRAGRESAPSGMLRAAMRVPEGGGKRSERTQDCSLIPRGSLERSDHKLHSTYNKLHHGKRKYKTVTVLQA